MKHCSTQEPATNTVKKYFAAFLLTLLVPLLAAEADVADGVRAYDAGWYEDALVEFLLAAEAGDTQAQLALARMYQFGEGVAQNDVEAARWTRAAAEIGDAVAQINLSQFFAAGCGVERDVAQSYFWLLLAAGQPVQGEMTSDVGMKYWASLEEGYFEATDEFDTIVLPFQDAALGEDQAAEEEPSVLENIMSPIGHIMNDVVSFVGSSVTGN